jgi:hypothetical protein
MLDASTPETKFLDNLNQWSEVLPKSKRTTLGRFFTAKKRRKRRKSNQLAFFAPSPSSLLRGEKAVVPKSFGLI